MSPLILVAATLVILGFGEIAALLGILFRYAIPRAPALFRVLLFAPMITASVACFALAFMLLTNAREVFGLEILHMAAVYFACEGLVLWTLVAYAVYWNLKGRKCPV